MVLIIKMKSQKYTYTHNKDTQEWTQWRGKIKIITYKDASLMSPRKANNEMSTMQSFTGN